MKQFIILTLLISGMSCSRSPDQIFAAVFDNNFRNIQIFAGQDRLLFDCCLWLHFKISKPDVETILQEYTEVNVQYNKWNSGLPPEVNWWYPDRFGKNGKYFEKQSQSGRLVEGIYINEDSTEAYYVNFYN